MKSVLLLSFLLLGALNASHASDRCIGKTYEPVFQDNKTVPVVSIDGPSSLSTSGTTQFSVQYEMDTGATPYFFWCVSIGTLTATNGVFSEVQWQLPSNWEEENSAVELYLVAGDMFGHEVYRTKTYENLGSEVEIGVPNVSFTTVYKPETSQFLFGYQGNANTDVIEFYSSFDKLSWNKFATKNVASGNFSQSIANSNNHSQIFFKAKAIDSVSNKSAETAIKVVSYNNAAIELPATPLLKSMNTSSARDYVDVRWYAVVDSSGQDNADNYQVASSISNNVNTATIVDIGDVTEYRASNLNDSTRYYFWVRAVNARGYSNWSQSQYVNINIPNEPTISNLPISPLNGATNVTKQPRFEWNGFDEDGDRIEYYVRFGESQGNLNYSSDWSSRERFDFDSRYSRPLKPNTTYYWQVTYRQENEPSSNYGGSYPVSPIWSFTTVGTGPDLSVTRVNLISEITTDEWLDFDVTVKNVGTENAADQDIIPYFIKNGSKQPFRSYRIGDMLNDLSPGQSEIVRVRLQFESSLIERNGIVYDNILSDGDNLVSFDIDYNQFDVDIDPTNNSRVFNASYSYASNPPIIEFFTFSKNHISGENDDYRYILGWKVLYNFVARSDVNITKAFVDYRVSENEPWQEVKSFLNINDDSFSPRDGLDGDKWTIPIDPANVSDRMQLRARVYNSDTVFTTAVSPVFQVFENSIEVDTLLTDKDHYTIGDEMLISYGILSKENVESLELRVKRGNFRELLFEHNVVSDGPLNVSDSLRFRIPNDSALIGSDAYVEAYAVDSNGAFSRVASLPIQIDQFTEVPAEFSAITDVFSNGYSFPPNLITQSVENSIVKVQVDDNNLIHLLVEQIAFWWVQGENSTSRNFQYYYLTYNPSTGATSVPKSLFQNQILNNGNLPDELFEDFIVNGSSALLLTENRNSGELKLYSSSGGQVTSQSVLSGEYALEQLANFNGGTFLLYRQGSGDERRLLRKQVFPALGSSNVVSSTVMTAPINLNGNKIYIPSYDLESTVDSSLISIQSTIEDRDNPSKYLKGTVKIFDSGVEALLLDDNLNVVLRTQDGLEENLFLLTNSYFDYQPSSSNVDIAAAVYADSIIFVYENVAINKYSIVSYDRNSKNVQTYELGNKVSRNNRNLDHISFNANQFLVIGNPDGDFDASAQLVTADLSIDRPKLPIVEINTSATSVEVNQEINIDWSLSGDISDIQKIDVIKTVDEVSSNLSSLNGSVRQYSYTQSSSSESIVTITVRVTNSLGETSEDSIVLRVLTPVVFLSFESDKMQVNLGEEISFSWTVDVNNGNQSYVGYRSCGNEDWVEIFSTRYQQQKISLDDVLGECLFKVVAGNQSIQLAHAINVVGVIYDFKDNSYLPSGDVSYEYGITDFQWETWFDDVVSFDILVKKSGDQGFEKIGSTVLRNFSSIIDFGDSFDWKVSFEIEGTVIESEIIHVDVNSLDTPVISDTELVLTDQGLFELTLNYGLVDGASAYDIYRSINGIFAKVGTSNSAHFTDVEIEIDSSYEYYVIATSPESNSKPSDVEVVSTAFDDSYNAVMDTANYQNISGISLLVDFHPSKSVPFESYEVLFGENSSNLLPYQTVSISEVAFENLEYATTYYVQVYPINVQGERLSSVPAELVFTTGFDTREVTELANVTAQSITFDSIQIAWTQVENADRYILYVDENGSGYQILTNTEQLEFVHSYGLSLGNTYSYKVKAYNSYGATVSSASDPIQLADIDSDGDGVLDSSDNCPAIKNSNQYDYDDDKLGNVCDPDDDNDGLSDEIEAVLGTNTLSDDTDSDGTSDYNEVVDINNPSDSDGDGKIDATESSIRDIDKDGIVDQEDPDDDPKDDGDILDYLPAIINGALKNRVEQ